MALATIGPFRCMPTHAEELATVLNDAFRMVEEKLENRKTWLVRLGIEGRAEVNVPESVRLAVDLVSVSAICAQARGMEGLRQ